MENKNEFKISIIILIHKIIRLFYVENLFFEFDM